MTAKTIHSRSVTVLRRKWRRSKHRNDFEILKRKRGRLLISSSFRLPSLYDRLKDRSICTTPASTFFPFSCVVARFARCCSLASIITMQSTPATSLTVWRHRKRHAYRTKAAPKSSVCPSCSNHIHLIYFDHWSGAMRGFSEMLQALLSRLVDLGELVIAVGILIAEFFFRGIVTVTFGMVSEDLLAKYFRLRAKIMYL